MEQGKLLQYFKMYCGIHTRIFSLHFVSLKNNMLPGSIFFVLLIISIIVHLIYLLVLHYEIPLDELDCVYLSAVSLGIVLSNMTTFTDFC